MNSINAVILIVSLLLLILFLGIALMDSAAYLPDQIPGYSPQVPD